MNVLHLKTITNGDDSHRSLNSWFNVAQEFHAEDLIRLLFQITNSAIAIQEKNINASRTDNFMWQLQLFQMINISPKVIRDSTDQEEPIKSKSHRLSMDSFQEKNGCVLDSLTNACEMLSLRSAKHINISPKVIRDSTDQEEPIKSKSHRLSMDSFQEKIGCVLDSVTNACEMLSLRSVKQPSYTSFKRSSSLPYEVCISEKSSRIIYQDATTSSSIRRKKMNKMCTSGSTVNSTEPSDIITQSDISLYLRKVDDYGCDRFQEPSNSGISSISYPSCFDGISYDSEEILEDEEYNITCSDTKEFQLDLSMSLSEDEESDILKAKSKDSLLSYGENCNNDQMNPLNDLLSVISPLNDQDDDKIPPTLIEAICSDDKSSDEDLSKDLAY